MDLGARVRVPSAQMRLKILLCWAVGLVMLGCATYREDLNRGQRLYDENQYDRALAIWRILEEDRDSLSLTDQARYAYLRGMTDLSLGFRGDARHWLAIAKAIEQEHPGGLKPDWKTRLEEKLDDLNRDVYGGADDLSQSESTVSEKKTKFEDTAGDSEAPACEGGCPEGNVCQSGECVPE